MAGAPGNLWISSDFWTHEIGSSWADKNSYGAFGQTSFASLRLQAANCGGNSAERSNLDFCNINSNSTKRHSDSSDETGDNGSGNAIAADNSAGAIVGSNSPSAFSQEPPTADLSPPMRGNVHARNRRHPVSTMDDPPTSVDDPTPPIDDTTTPVDDLIAPIVYSDPLSVDPVVSIGNTGPLSDPVLIFTPPPESPIPETSTEVMIMLGFGIMFIVTQSNARNSIKNRLIRALYKLY